MKMPRYKVTIENMSDPTDKTVTECHSVVAFVGLYEEEQARIDHGMLFSGNKRVMAEVISSIPPQVAAFVDEENARADKKIIQPDGKDGGYKN